jgi:purine nucleoside phosphorylase
VKLKQSYSFVLPDGRGFSTQLGTKIHGKMRPAKVRDFIAIQQDTRVQENKAFFYVSLLCRVLESLGTERMITTATVGKLSPEDFAFLVDLFNEINHGALSRRQHTCECGETFWGEVRLPGEA